eukprot:scaffold71218_cov17-Tisochrysis_lutea.AAC.1
MVGATHILVARANACRGDQMYANWMLTPRTGEKYGNMERESWNARPAKHAANPCKSAHPVGVLSISQVVQTFSSKHGQFRTFRDS